MNNLEKKVEFPWDYNPEEQVNYYIIENRKIVEENSCSISELKYGYFVKMSELSKLRNVPSYYIYMALSKNFIFKNNKQFTIDIIKKGKMHLFKLNQGLIMYLNKIIEISRKYWRDNSRRLRKAKLKPENKIDCVVYAGKTDGYAVPFSKIRKQILQELMRENKQVALDTLRFSIPMYLMKAKVNCKIMKRDEEAYFRPNDAEKLKDVIREAFRTSKKGFPNKKTEIEKNKPFDITKKRKYGGSENFEEPSDKDLEKIMNEE